MRNEEETHEARQDEAREDAEVLTVAELTLAKLREITANMKKRAAGSIYVHGQRYYVIHYSLGIRHGR